MWLNSWGPMLLNFPRSSPSCTNSKDIRYPNSKSKRLEKLKEKHYADSLTSSASCAGVSKPVMDQSQAMHLSNALAAFHHPPIISGTPVSLQDLAKLRRKLGCQNWLRKKMARKDWNSGCQKRLPEKKKCPQIFWDASTWQQAAIPGTLAPESALTAAPTPRLQGAGNSHLPTAVYI